MRTLIPNKKMRPGPERTKSGQRLDYYVGGSYDPFTVDMLAFTVDLVLHPLLIGLARVIQSPVISRFKKT